MASYQVLKYASVATILSVVYYVYWQLTTGARRRAIIREHGCEAPNTLYSRDPILGLDRFFAFNKAFKEHRMCDLVTAWFAENRTHTYVTNVLGQNRILTCDMENIKHVLATDFKNWSLGDNRVTAMTVLLGRGIFVNDGDAWQHSRELLRPSFVRTSVRDLDSLDTHVDHLIASIPRDQSMVDLSPLFFRLTIDSATAFLFGKSTNTLAPGIATVSGVKFAECFNRAQEHCATQIRFGPFSWLASGSKQYKEDCKFIHNFIDTFVDDAMARRPHLLAEKATEGRYVFLEELARLTTDRIAIRSELLNILLAGRDTTASLLSNLWWSISHRPDVWAKLREEVDALGGEKPTFDQIREMKYLRAVVNESLRLHPVVPFNQRTATSDTYLPRGGGKDGRSPILVPKGRTCNYTVMAMQRRKDIYGADADEFVPERWLGDKGIRPGWEYLPFNGGPRICLGQQFALTEASYVTVRLMQEFRSVESRDPHPWTEYIHLTSVGLNGAKVSLTPFSNA